MEEVVNRARRVIAPSLISMVTHIIFALFLYFLASSQPASGATEAPVSNM
jgi:hypothetical protein